VELTVTEALSNPALKTARILDIAPQIHKGVMAYASSSQVVETLDLVDTYMPTYVGDICSKNSQIPDNTFDAVFLLEVIEHVYEPKKAIEEIRRILKKGGLFIATSPYNFRIHGPLPDCWRISEHGWRYLLSDFENIQILPLETEDRFLMPIHYRVLAQTNL
jgi:SAM-dependent methyltransferase